MPSRIPTPELIGEAVEGAVYDLPGGNALVIGAAPASLASRSPLVSGSLTVRYAIPLQQPPTDAVIPGLFAAERGGMLVGREAWDYIQDQFQVHPRADVVGVRPDGAQFQVFLRELDFGVPIRVLVYDRPDATIPRSEVKALVIGESATPTPELLSKYLPLVALDSLLTPPGEPPH